jgi:hypothetical protein
MAPNLTQIPMTNQPNRSFQCTIPIGSIGNETLQFFTSWNNIAQYWQMNIMDSGSNPLICDIPMVSGLYQNMLYQWSYLGIGSAYIMPYSTATTPYPGVNDWGTNFYLLWVS